MSCQISGLWERINRHVVKQERIKQNRPTSPSVWIIDSLDLVLAVMVDPANNHDACAAKMLLQKLELGRL